jgi:hypothetical protein
MFFLRSLRFKIFRIDLPDNSFQFFGGGCSAVCPTVFWRLVIVAQEGTPAWAISGESFILIRKFILADLTTAALDSRLRAPKYSQEQKASR